jgi:arginase
MVNENKKFCVLGGDHSCAIGTWSGVHEAISAKGDLGLIWVDAHMDSHTPETSPSGRVHGMPLAVLLGHGDTSLTSILNSSPKIKPENLCLIGIRSYEPGEAALLEKLKIRIYFMEEVRQRGFVAVLQEAVAHVKQHTHAYGLTIDLDSLDPHEAPGVDVPEENGIHVAELYQGLQSIIQDPQLIATEITEFDPTHDQEQKTEKIIACCLDIIAGNAA